MCCFIFWYNLPLHFAFHFISITPSQAHSSSLFIFLCQKDMKKLKGPNSRLRPVPLRRRMTAALEHAAHWRKRCEAEAQARAKEAQKWETKTSRLQAELLEARAALVCDGNKRLLTLRRFPLEIPHRFVEGWWVGKHFAQHTVFAARQI
jgi:hypothetical protein